MYIVAPVNDLLVMLLVGVAVITSIMALKPYRGPIYLIISVLAGIAATYMEAVVFSRAWFALFLGLYTLYNLLRLLYKLKSY